MPSDGPREVVVSSNLTQVKKYHLPDSECRYADSLEATRRMAEPLAKRAGLDLCKTCDPTHAGPTDSDRTMRRSLRQILADRGRA